MEITQIISYVITGITTLLTIVIIILNLINNKKKKATSTIDTNGNKVGTETTTSNSENTTKRSKNGIELTVEKLQKVLGYITSAEQLFSNVVGKCGDKKLTEVLRNIKVDCLTNKEKFNEQEWTTVVNDLVKLTKTINN